MELIKLNGKSLHIHNDELLTWLVSNFGNGVWLFNRFDANKKYRWGWEKKPGTQNNIIFFKDSADATFFKLTWEEVILE